MPSSPFGQLVRRQRGCVAPETVGLGSSKNRRTPGLRREELARLAGISPDYLTRLEQGRATSPSGQVVESLARALRLPDAERDLLYQLAGYTAPGLELVPMRVPPSVQRLLDRLGHTPVAVYDATWSLIVANAPYDAVLGEISGLRGPERNAVWRNLTGSATRVRHTPGELADLQARQVADLRVTAARYPTDRKLRRLIHELSTQSPRFVHLWESSAPEPTTDPSRRKIIEHPTVGPIALDCDVLIVASDDLRIMVYTAEPGTEDAERLAFAIVLGAQTLVE